MSGSNQAKPAVRQRPVVTAPQEGSQTESVANGADEGTSDKKAERAPNTIGDLISDLISCQAMFLETIRRYWDVPMSKDTVFLFGEMKGHFTEITSSLRRDED